MTGYMERFSLRTRLTLLFVVAVFILLLLYGSGVVVFVRHHFSVDLDRLLQEDFEVAHSMIAVTANGSVVMNKSEHSTHIKIANIILAEAWNNPNELLFSNEIAERLGNISKQHSFGKRQTNTLDLPDGTRMRYLEGPNEISGLVVMIRVYRSEESLHETVRHLILIMLFTFPFGLILAYIAGRSLASHLLAPVTNMADHAEAITAEHLDERLPVELPHDDVGRLAIAFNHTLARLEKSFQDLRQFTSDASHELRTPLTCIRSVGEVALREDRDIESYREAIGSMLEESDRLAQLVNTLLKLSRTDSQQMNLPREQIDLNEISQKVSEDLGVLAEEKNQTINVEKFDGAIVMAVREVLCLAFVNLIDNAIKYSPEGTAIRIVVGKDKGFATVKVIDQGCGIPSQMTDKVFDRFYRVDKSRSKEVGGHGLGLVIARWAVEINGGSLGLISKENEGSEFQIRIPLDVQLET